MRIGLVCPYPWEIPGGVQAHVRDLAAKLLELGHHVSVLAPADEDADLPPHVVAAGRAGVRIPYNGSVARLQFGLVAAARVRRWLRDGDFDVVHVHEPAPPSLSLLACVIHDGPLVSTFHSSVIRSRMLSAVEPVLAPFLEKITGKIAVSNAARKVIVEHLGGDAVVIPNGVDVAHFAQGDLLPGYPRPSAPQGGTIGFVGRFDESRKGMGVLVEAIARLAQDRPNLRVLVAGRGDAEDFREELPAEVTGHFELLGQVDEAGKARMLRSVDVYCAPNTGGESFGIILLEAMAAGTPVVASDLEAFRRVLDGGAAGQLFPTGDAAGLADALRMVLDDPELRARLAAAGSAAVTPFDWSVIVADVLRVYELTITGAGVAP